MASRDLHPTSSPRTAAGPHALWALVDSGYDSCPPPEGHGDILESLESNNATTGPLFFCVSSPDQEPGGGIDLRADSLEVSPFRSTFFGGTEDFTGLSAGSLGAEIFTDGFESGNVSAWSTGDSAHVSTSR